MTAPSKNQTGTSLVEVVVALLLLGIGVLGAAPLFVTSLEVGATGGEVGSLNAAAAARMEALRAAPFGSLAVGGGLSSNVVGYSDASDPKVTVRWEITTGSGPTGTRTIRVRALNVTALAGDSREVTLVGLRAR